MNNRKIITNKEIYHQVLKHDELRTNQLYGWKAKSKQLFIAKLVQDQRIILSNYVRLLRKEEFLANTRTWYKLPYLFVVRIYRNRLSAKLGIHIPINVCDSGLVIWHYGNIAINGNSIIGRNCQLHGGNCIGNKGIEYIEDAPILGDNVDVGFGASVIGKIYIANNVKIGAGAVVTKSCNSAGSTITGIPAK